MLPTGLEKTRAMGRKSNETGPWWEGQVAGTGGDAYRPQRRGK